MKIRALLLLLLLPGAFLFAACGSTASSNTSSTPMPAPSPVTLNILAASSLTKSFGTLATNYHTLHPNVTIKGVYDSSTALEQQIANGAPADIFASADTTNMQKAAQANLVDASQIFAENRLVVILPVSNPGHITTLKDLSNAGVKIDLANATVPVGKYARQVLDNLGKSSDYGAAYEAAVLKNVVSEEATDAAIVQKVQLGEADAGIVYVSDINSTDAAQFTSIAIPDNFNVISQYPIAAVKSSAHIADDQAFIQYVLSSAGQNVLKQYNFIPVNS
jgi:molybdate transport system substrate-binding protein